MRKKCVVPVWLGLVMSLTALAGQAQAGVLMPSQPTPSVPMQAPYSPGPQLAGNIDARYLKGLRAGHFLPISVLKQQIESLGRTQVVQILAIAMEDSAVLLTVQVTGGAVYTVALDPVDGTILQ